MEEISRGRAEKGEGEDNKKDGEARWVSGDQESGGEGGLTETVSVVRRASEKLDEGNERKSRNDDE